MIYEYLGLILLASLITTADKLIRLLICMQDAQLKVEEMRFGYGALTAHCKVPFLNLKHPGSFSWRTSQHQPMVRTTQKAAAVLKGAPRRRHQGK